MLAWIVDFSRIFEEHRDNARMKFWTLSEKHKLGFGARTTASLAEQNRTAVTRKFPSGRTSTLISAGCGVNIQETQEDSAILSVRLWNISATKPMLPEGTTTSISAR